MFLRWFLSSAVRDATALGRHVRKIYNHQRDIIAPQAGPAILQAIADLKKAISDGADKEALGRKMEELGKVADKWLKPYPNAALRENIEVLLVALTVAMGVRTFFLQPFKIPTGSMQPTLYGVLSYPDSYRPGGGSLGKANFQIPTGWQRVKEWFAGVSYVNVKAKCDGDLEEVRQPFKILIFNIYQTLQIGGKTHWILFPPDYGSETLTQRMGLTLGSSYNKGDDVVRLKMVAGDHLFVDRITYNFRPPERGEIIVFDTHGIEGLSRDQQDTFYIKRLCGLGGETISLKQDRFVSGVPGSESDTKIPVGHLVINGKEISQSTPHFQNVYSCDAAPSSQQVIPFQENHYVGHALLWELGQGKEVHVGKDDYFVMGDNTMNSYDSRKWGDFAQNKVIGRSFFVYWPITERFGWGYQR